MLQNPAHDRRLAPGEVLAGLSVEDDELVADVQSSAEAILVGVFGGVVCGGAVIRGGGVQGVSCPVVLRTFEHNSALARLQPL